VDGCVDVEGKRDGALDSRVPVGGKHFDGEVVCLLFVQVVCSVLEWKYDVEMLVSCREEEMISSTIDTGGE